MTRALREWQEQHARTGLPRMKMDEAQRQAEAWAKDCGIDLNRNALGVACYHMFGSGATREQVTLAYARAIQERFDALLTSINDRLERAAKRRMEVRWIPCPGLILLPSIQDIENVEAAINWCVPSYRITENLFDYLSRLIAQGVGEPRLMVAPAPTRGR